MNWLPMLLAMVLGGVMDELALVGSVSADETRASDVFFRQFLAQHCHTCHAGSKPKGEFHEENLSQDFVNEPNRRLWLKVLEQLKEGAMPPMDEPRLGCCNRQWFAAKHDQKAFRYQG